MIAKAQAESVCAFDDIFSEIYFFASKKSLVFSASTRSSVKM